MESFLENFIINLTPGPAVTCFLTVLVLTAYTSVILNRRRGIFSGRIKFLLLLIAIICIRMVIPFNYPFTQNIPSHRILVFLFYPFCNYYKIAGVSIYALYILLAIWCAGALIQLFRFFRKYVRFKQFLSYHIADCPELRADYSEIFTSFPKLKIAVIPDMSSPAIAGLLHPVLILPDNDFPSGDMCYILKHELAHFRNHDLWLKLLIELAVCIQWWNPFIYKLRKRLFLICEISNDRVVADSLSQEEVLDYASCLLRLARAKNAAGSSAPAFSMVRSKSDLQKRLDILLNIPQVSLKKRIVSLSWHTLLIGLLVIFTVIFTPEPYYEDTSVTEGTCSLTPENAYIIEHENGFDIYLEDEYWGTIQQIDSSLKELPVYKKGE